MEQRSLTYMADGIEFEGVLIAGRQIGRAPGVLVAHEAPGRDQRMILWAHKLAEAGYVALALDLYGAPFSMAEAMSRHQHLMETPGLMLRRAWAALDALAEQPDVDRNRMAAVGFCQGGIVAAELARGDAPILAAIGFHPGLSRPAGSPDGPINAKVLMMVGDRDPVVPKAERQAFAAEMDAKGVDWQLHLFGGVGHMYTNPVANALGRDGFGYNAKAEHRAWSMALSLLDEVFGPPSGPTL